MAKTIHNESQRRHGIAGEFLTIADAVVSFNLD
jgi:hypothetical protein